MKSALLLVIVTIGLLSPIQKANADQVRYVSHPREALASFIHIIDSATTTLDIATFIFEPCHPSTQVLINHITERATKGVRVRLLIDSITVDAKEKQAITTYFAGYGVEVRWYNTQALSINYRSHIKMIVANSQRYISGGRNFADEYFGLRVGQNFVDRDVYVSGVSARNASISFEEIWNSGWVSRVNAGLRSFNNWNQVCPVDQTARVAVLEKYMKKNGKRLVNAIPARSCPNVQFLADKPGSSLIDNGSRGKRLVDYAQQSGKRTTSAILRFIRETTQSLEFENWSFMPGDGIQYELDQLRDQNIPMFVFTNDDMDGPAGLKTAEDFSNNNSVNFQNRGSLGVIQISMQGSLNDGWELSPNKRLMKFRLHGKVLVRNHRDVIVSSYNIDPRSYDSNLESMVIVSHCRSLATDVQKNMNQLRDFYLYDTKHNLVPPKTDPNILVKLLALLAHTAL